MAMISVAGNDEYESVILGILINSSTAPQSIEGVGMKRASCVGTTDSGLVHGTLRYRHDTILDRWTFVADLVAVDDYGPALVKRLREDSKCPEWSPSYPSHVRIRSRRGPVFNDEGWREVARYRESDASPKEQFVNGKRPSGAPSLSLTP